MARSGNKQPAIDQAEHIGPDDTGDNIEAKRVVPYFYTGDVDNPWTRQTGGLLAGIAYDDIVFSSEDANANPQVATVKLDGATVATLGMTYNTSSKLTRIHRTS